MMRFKWIVTIVLISLSSLFSHVAQSLETKPLEATFTLGKNNPNHNFNASITLKNNTAHPIKNWQLAFNFSRAFVQIDEGKISKQVGDFFILTPTNIQSIAAHSEFIFHLIGKWDITHITEAPQGYFLIINHPETQRKDTILPVAATPEPLPLSSATASVKPVTPSSLSVEQSLIIPLPASLKRAPGEFVIGPTTKIQADQNAIQAATFFIHAIRPATGYHLVITKSQHFKNNIINFTTVNADPALGREGYILEITPQRISIRAIDEAGFFYAVQSLRQLLPPAIFKHTRSQHILWRIPSVSIHDTPRFPYRGLHLDVARHFIPKDQVLRLIDLMALHKLNQLHLHLSDDQGWRLEIKHYPTLTTIGAWRGYQHIIPPANGSGANLYGGYYSQNDIRNIVNYASKQHITIIPEIDIPGHSRALIMSLPKLLIDPEDRSEYGSVHGYHDNALSPCLDNTYQVLDNIFTEVAKLFPGKLIHVGADEIPPGVWEKSPRCAALMASLKLKDTHELQQYFLMRVQKILAAKNKTLAGWEEILQGDRLNHSAWVYIWTSEKVGLKAAKEGYPVVMMPVTNFYFDLAYNNNPNEPGATWSDPVDTFKTYSWQISSTQNIQGVEAALWSENITSRQRLDYLAFPRLLALAEVAWTPDSRRDWANFLDRVNHLHLKRLDNLGVQYRHGSI